MWVFTDTGFISAVAHYDDSDTIVVRARDMASLDGIAALADVAIQTTPYNDYPFRVHVSRPIFQEWLCAAVTDMEYTNFKNRVHETRGERFHDALSDVWSTMHDVEDRRK
jgi:hypothetical protein